MIISRRILGTQALIEMALLGYGVNNSYRIKFYMATPAKSHTVPRLVINLYISTYTYNTTAI